MPFWLYSALGWVALPVLLLAALLRREPWARLKERFGRGEQTRSGLWFHAASVGELRAIAPLLERFEGEISHVTVQSRQGYEIGKALGLPIQMAPLDLPPCASAFLKRHAVTGLVLFENELWPGWLRALDQKGTGAVLLNASLGKRSRQFWSKNRALLQGLKAASFVAQPLNILAESEPHLPLKLAGKALPIEGGIVAEWLKWLAGEQPLIFANVHPSELNAIVEIIDAKAPSKVIIAPRHPDKIETFKTSLGDPSDRLAYWESFGTLGSLYALGGTVVLGGGFLEEVGSHNPMEPLRSGRPIVLGPFAGKQTDIVELLHQHDLVSTWPDWPERTDVDMQALAGLGTKALDQAEGLIRRTLLEQ